MNSRCRLAVFLGISIFTFGSGRPAAQAENVYATFGTFSEATGYLYGFGTSLVTAVVPKPAAITIAGLGVGLLVLSRRFRQRSTVDRKQHA